MSEREWNEILEKNDENGPEEMTKEEIIEELEALLYEGPKGSTYRIALAHSEAVTAHTILKLIVCLRTSTSLPQSEKFYWGKFKTVDGKSIMVWTENPMTRNEMLDYDDTYRHNSKTVTIN